MQIKMPYFESPLGISLLAHRGLIVPGSGLVENTAASFEAALAAGASHIETDVQCTNDGVAVLFHDATVVRLTGINRRLDSMSWSELQEAAKSSGFDALSLEAALRQFPVARFNLDLKTMNAVEPTMQVLTELESRQRVLLTSFSDSRRLHALTSSREPIPSSAGTETVIRAKLATMLRSKSMLRVAMTGTQAVQVPEKMYGVEFAKSSFIQPLRSIGAEVHFWTINSPKRAEELIAMGATGIVSDRVDLIAPILGKG
jgi:glycerophosphoryl diester phosphodiesterase